MHTTVNINVKNVKAHKVPVHVYPCDVRAKLVLFLGRAAAAINNKTTFVLNVAPQLPPIAQPQHRLFNFPHPPRRMVPRPSHRFQTIQPRPQPNFMQRQLQIMQRFLQNPPKNQLDEYMYRACVFFFQKDKQQETNNNKKTC